MFDLRKKDSNGKRIIIFTYLKACLLEIKWHSFRLLRIMANSRRWDFWAELIWTDWEHVVESGERRGGSSKGWIKTCQHGIEDIILGIGFQVRWPPATAKCENTVVGGCASESLGQLVTCVQNQGEALPTTRPCWNSLSVNQKPKGKVSRSRSASSLLSTFRETA